MKSNRPNVIGVLVGNKSEFRSSLPGTFEASRAEVAEEDALGVAATLEVKHFETSAVLLYNDFFYSSKKQHFIARQIT